jgi:hypothetical protein
MNRFVVDPAYPFDHERTSERQVAILEEVGISDREDRQMLVCDRADAAFICAALNSGWATMGYK